MQEKKPSNINRKAFMLIMGLPLILMLLSYTLMYLVENENLDVVDLLGTKTLGKLVQPVKPVADLHLQDETGAAFDYAKEEKHIWTLLILNSPSCGERCAVNLIQTRQMHIAMGKEQKKIRRYQLFLDGKLDPVQMDKLRSEHPQLKTVYGSSDVLKNLMADQKIDDWNNIAYLLLDKRGWIMMAYDESVKERDMMKKDLHHLFKYAQ